MKRGTKRRLAEARADRRRMPGIVLSAVGAVLVWPTGFSRMLEPD